MIKKIISSPFFLVVLLSIFLVWIQIRFAFFSGILGVKLNYLPIFALYMALFRSWKELFVFVVVSGLLYDSFSLNPLGTSLLSLLIPTYIIYSCRTKLLISSSWLQMLLGFAVLIFSEGLVLLILTGLPVVPTMDGTLIWTFVVLGVSGAVLTPIVVVVLNRMTERMKKMKSRFFRFQAVERL